MAYHTVAEKTVRPQDLCFTQEWICVTFRKPHDQERIDDAVDLIIQGRLSPTAFPKMNVVLFQDRLWSLDNRRLWVFKKAEVSFIKVTIVTYDTCNGLHSLMSSSPYMIYTLSKRDFFPRIRGVCKQVFIEEDPEEPSSLPLPPTPRVRVPEVYSKSKHLDYDDHHHRRLHHRPPSPPQSKKRPYQTERHHERFEVRSPPPAKKSRVSNSPAPAWTPYGECSSPPPAKKQRGHASHHIREFRTPHAMQKAPIPLTPEQRPRAPRPPKEVRAPSSTRKGNPPSSSTKPKTVTRSSERMADRSGNLPSCRTTEPKVLHSREKHAEKGPAAPVSKEKRAERDREATSRAVENPIQRPSLKKSKTPKPMSSPPNFSYDFHSSQKRARASKDSKKTTASCHSTKSSSTPLNDAAQTLPLPASPKTRHAKSKMSTVPLPSLSTTASPSRTTKRKERGDNFTAELPIPSVPAPKSPLGTSKKSDQELNSGTSSATKARQESPVLVHAETMTQTESDLFKLDKQAPAVDPELNLRLTPCKELTPQDRQTLDAIVELFLRDAKSPLKPAHVKPRVEVQIEQTEAVIPTDVEVCVTTPKQQEEPEEDVSVRVDVSPLSVVECPVKYDSKGQLFESTLKVWGPLSNPSTTCFGDGDRQRVTGNVGVTVTADLEPPAAVKQLQSTPETGRQVEETQPETEENATDHQHTIPPQGTKVLAKRYGYRDMAWIEKAEVTARLTKPIQELPILGNGVQNTSLRVTRSQIKKLKEMERRKARQKRKEKEKEAKLKKDSEAQSLPEKESEPKGKVKTKEKKSEANTLPEKEKEVKPKAKAKKDKKKESEAKSSQKENPKKKVTTDIVPYNPERSKEVTFGVGTYRNGVQNGDMLYVKVDAEFTGCGTEGLKKSPRSKVRLHPYLRIIGPFAIQGRYNAYAVRLELPNDCDLRPVFPMKTLLKSRSPLDNYLPEKRLLVKLVPETILKKRMARRLKKRKVLHYLVKWKTLPATEATWESETIFDEYPHLLDQIDDCPLFTNPYLHRNWRI